MGTNKINKIMASMPWNKAKKNAYISEIRRRYDYTQPVPTILSCECTGGIIYHNLGLPFNSPTINLFFSANDFIKFVTNLEYYLQQRLVFSSENQCSYPVATLGDITINFLHYHSITEAKDSWERRAKRVDLDHVFVITHDYKLTKENYVAFDNITNCRAKIMFTKFEDEAKKPNRFLLHREQGGYLPCYSVLQSDGFREFEKVFDYVEFLKK